MNSTRTVIDLIDPWCTSIPHAIAVVSDQEALTYAELDRRSNAVAAALAAAGIGSGQMVPVEATRSADFIIGMLGIMKAGAAYIPIDHTYPVARKLYIVEQSRSPLLLTTVPAGSFAPAGVSLVDVVSLQQKTGLSPVYRPSPPAGGDPVYVIFTSGTTGVPKGVIVEHHSVADFIAWHNRQFGVDGDSRSTSMAALGFDVAHWEIWSALCAGSRLYLPGDAVRRDAVELVRLFDREAITHAFVPTVMVADVIKAGGAGPSSLKYLFTGGEKLNPVDTDGIHYSFIDYYGPTEATIWSTFHEVPSASRGLPPSIGKPVADTGVLILDAGLREVSAGDTGEICLAGPCLARGYLHNEKLTAERFPQYPSVPGQRIYRTGDLGRWLDDGSVQFLGRIDEQVKIRGHLVEPGEIEVVIARHPDVRNVSVTATSPVNGELKELIAFVVPRNDPADQKALIRRLRASARDFLPDYMVPSHFVIRDDFPLNANGKTDKSALLAGFLQATIGETGFGNIEDPTLRSVMETFREALGHTDFDASDNLFDIGGHSMLAAQVIASLSRQMDLALRITDIYNHPSAEGLAGEIDSRKHAAGEISDHTSAEELWRDVELSSDILFDREFDPARLTSPAHILLTGVTGFVGIHLLAELLATTGAEVHCIVRARDETEAMRRIKDKIEEFQVSIIEGGKERIRAHPGDITSEHFGMPQTAYAALCHCVDVIHHSASAVNFIKPYAAMKRDNVDGLKNIIRFAAAEKTKALILLSTISIYSWGYWITGKEIVTENEDIDENLEAICADIGYVKSKWVMEKIAGLAEQRGLPLMTFRLGYATYHATTGLSANYQWWGRLVKTCISLGLVPDLKELREGLSSVDYMAKATAHIARNPDGLGRKFNLIHSGEQNVSLKQFFTLLERYFGFRFKVIPFSEWRDLWKDDARTPLYPVLNLFRDHMHQDKCILELYQHTYRWQHDNTSSFLEGSGIQAPAFDQAELGRYLEHSIGISLNEHQNNPQSAPSNTGARQRTSVLESS